MLSTSPKKSAGTHTKKREREGTATMATPTAETTVPAVESAPRKKRRKEAAVKRAEDGEQAWAWTALAESSVSALPPLFTPDSRYFFTAAASSLQIFSTATGKLVSTIPAHSDTITALILNPHDSTQLFSASLDGTLKRWDTHHGALLETLRIDQPVTHIAAHSSLADELFVVTTASQSKNSDSSHVFRVTTKSQHQLPSPTSSLSNPPKAHKSSRTTHVGKTRRATGLAVSACGEFLIAIGGNKAYVSRTRGSGGFTTFVSPDPLTCVAVHPTESYFATGDERGVVRLWYCLNDATPDPSSSNPKYGSATAATTTLHWHAHTVSALAFAPSGAQLLSGGEEAVLVVWQLHSGQREYIPRVGAPIGAVSVCFGPTGGMEYAIALADGGVVFVGNDTLRIRRAVRRVRLDPAPTRPFPFVSHSATNRIILPATHPASLQILSRSGAGLNLIGELEVAPASRVSRKDETPIEPVRVGLVAISEKGKSAEGGDWLATVDSRADAEVYLKFWKWNGAAATTTTTASNLCTLNTRIDRPHGDHRVTSIAFHVEKLATTGEDGLVKLWGVRKTQDEEYWICAASFNYRNHTPSKALFSPDGSLLAVIHGSCVTLWDTSNGDSVSVPMRGALSCVETKEPRELAFVGSSGRYLAVLGSQTVALWDLVRLSVIWHVPLTFTAHQPAHIVSHPTQPAFALFQYPDSKSTRISTYGVATPTQLSARVLPFKLDQPLWSPGAGDFGALGVGSTDDSRWSLILAGDEVQSVSAQGGGINLDNAPFVPRTLFEDIFGRGAVAPKPAESKENERDLGDARAREDVKSAKRARRKVRRAEKMKAEVEVQEAEAQGDSDLETPDSSEPATEADIEGEPTVEAVTYIGIKRKASLGGVDGTIHAVKNLVNGVVGVHSASDDEQDEPGEEVV